MVNQINIGNMKACVQDVYKHAAIEEDSKFDEYHHKFDKLLNDLGKARDSLPFSYQEGVVDPFLLYLTQLGNEDFTKIFTDPESQLNRQERFLRQIIPDIAQAILLNHNGYEERASDAFQELVSDLYDGFLSEEDRRSAETGRTIAPPDRGVLPPLVKWGSPEAGPYTWTIRATSQLGLKAPIVSLPPGHAKGGLLAWSSLGHETGGHDILHADTGLLKELKDKVYRAVLEESKSVGLASYWSRCTDETASDVLGLLNMGPAAGIGLIGYFRGLNATEASPEGKLRNVGLFDGPHPIDVLRGFVAAEIVSNLNFNGAAEWAQLIEVETKKNLDETLYVSTSNGYYSIPPDIGEKTARIAAQTIAESSLKSLEEHKLSNIQNWTDLDEGTTQTIMEAFVKNKSLPKEYLGKGFYATHVVAAGTLQALKEGSDIGAIFKQMKAYLVEMHSGNATWENVFEPHFLLGPSLAKMDNNPEENLINLGSLC